MRVLYFTEKDSPHDRRFLTALAGTSHTVFALRQNMAALATSPGIVELDWPGGQPDWKAWAGWEDGKRKLQQIIDKIQPDLVHAGPVQGPALLVALAGFHPLVTMSWGFDMLNRVNRSPWMRTATAYTLAQSDVFVADCQTVVNKALSYGFSPDRVVQFPWGVDLDLFSPQNGKAEARDLRQRLGWGDKFVILCNRTWSPIYGVDLMAKAFVQAVGENQRLRLILAGGGQQADLIHATLAAVADKVYFPGWVAKDDLPGVYNAADLFISPSHCDGSSVSLLEALACGLPALVSDIPSNQEWVTPGKNGALFYDGDADDLSRALLQMAADANLNAYGKCARLLAEARANWQVNFSMLLDAYQMALG